MLPDYTNWRQLVADSDIFGSPEAADSKSPVFLIVDDHDAILQCLIPLIKAAYPEAVLLAAHDGQSAILQIEQRPLSLAILDLELPAHLGESARNETGLSTIKAAMQQEQVGSIMVLGENVKSLRQIKSEIYRYKTGFAAADKTQPVATVLNLIDLALKESIHLPLEVRSQTEFSDKWATVLRLKYQEGLSDKAIASRLSVSPRTIRNYWPGIQDKLGVYDDPNKDLRVQIEQAARQAGLIS